VRVRLAFALLALAAIVVVTASAGAHLVPVGGPPPQHFAGPDKYGRVTLEYTEAEGYSPPGIFNLKFANKCAAEGTAVPTKLVIPIRGHHLFSYSGHDITVSGKVHGSLLRPSAITGTASVKIRNCHSGEVTFRVTPSRP
jgi:hypothetical protein